MIECIILSYEEVNIVKPRRIIALILSTLLLLGTFPISASALGETPVGYIELLPETVTSDNIQNDPDYIKYRSFLENHSDLITDIYDGITSMKKEINIFSYRIPYNDLEALAWIINNSFPELCFNTLTRVRLYSNNMLYSLFFDYAENSEEMQEAFLQSAAERYLDAVKPDKLIVMPTGVPPHKIKAKGDTPDARLEMCHAA